MKKLLYLLICSMLTISIVSATHYYTSRTGEVLQAGTNIPIKKDMNMNLTCNTFSFSYKTESIA